MNEKRLPNEFSCQSGRFGSKFLLWFAQALYFALWILLMPTASAVQATEADDALLRAIAGRDPVGFQAALTAGASARATDSGGDTALHRAVIYWGDVVVIEKLLSVGVDLNAANGAGETPLLRSLQHVHYSSDPFKVEQIVKLLLARGARAALADAKGITPAAAALESGRLPLVKAVVDAGGHLPPDALLKVLALGTDVPLIQFLLEHAQDIDLKLHDSSGRTAAHLAAGAEQRLFLLRWLVKHGADLQARDRQLNTLLATAAAGDNLPGMAFLVGLRLQLNAVNADGMQVIHMAAYGARYPALQWLVEQGVDLQARDRWGRRALDVAIDSKRYAFDNEADRRALIKLLGGGADDYARGRFYGHPLHLAIRSENLREVQRLLDAGADANVKDESGYTPLKRAIDLASGGPATSDQRSNQVRPAVAAVADEAWRRQYLAHASFNAELRRARPEQSLCGRTATLESEVWERFSAIVLRDTAIVSSSGIARPDSALLARKSRSRSHIKPRPAYFE
ncbi:MAG: ankyrin repeat domain-containing protein [Burkholderiales bacterium]